jgi:hypothetical protein
VGRVVDFFVGPVVGHLGAALLASQQANALPISSKLSAISIEFGSITNHTWHARPPIEDAAKGG